MKISSRALAACAVANSFVLKFTFLCIAFLVTSTSCKKNGSNTRIEPPPEPVALTGKIILPEGVNLDLALMKVHAPMSASAITDSRFNIVANAKQFNTVFLLNEEGSTLLMGYYLPSDSIVSISIHTTALALAMNTPTILSFPLETKKEITTLVIESRHFEELKSEITTSISRLKDLFDESNLNVFKKLNEVIKEAVRAAVEVRKYPPIYLKSDGNKLGFVNESKSFTTVAGIYRNQKLIQKVTVAGRQALSLSIKDYINGGISLQYPDSRTTETVELSEDGQYDVRMRTGLPGYDDGTEEYSEALNANMVILVEYFAKSYLSMETLRPESHNCIRNLVNHIVNGILTVRNIANENIENAVLSAAMATIENIETLYSCVYPGKDAFNEEHYKQLKKFLKGLNRLKVLTDIIPTAANALFMSVQWISARPAFDTCFLVQNDTIHKCLTGNWKITAADYNPAVEYDDGTFYTDDYAKLLTCEKDNVTAFEENGSYKVILNTKCNFEAGDPDILVGTWLLSSATKQLILGDLTNSNQKSIWDVVSLTDTNLKIARTFTSGQQLLTYTVTYTRQ